LSGSGSLYVPSDSALSLARPYAGAPQVESLSYPQQQALLRFWSGSSTPPLYGFDPKFNEDGGRPHRPSGGLDMTAAAHRTGQTWCITLCQESPASLPKASTCSYLLRVPPYTSEEVYALRRRVA
jgi:hypothetical protein